jgi:hypothetical protein
MRIGNEGKLKAINRSGLILSLLTQAALLVFPVYFLLGLHGGGSARSRPKMEIDPVTLRLAAQSPRSVDSERDQRMALLEAELSSLQQENAKNPARPTVAQLHKELDQLVASTGGRTEVSQTLQIRWLYVLSMGLATVLLFVAYANLKGQRGTQDPAVLDGK